VQFLLVLAPCVPRKYQTWLERLAKEKLSILFGLFVIEGENSCIARTPGKIILKHFTVVIYKCSKYARVLVPGKPLKPSSLV
jgi:hypothetical protein